MWHGDEHRGLTLAGVVNNVPRNIGKYYKQNSKKAFEPAATGWI